MGVVLGDGPAAAAVHPVLGRAPVVLAEPDPVPRLDERVLNPRGFRAGTAGPVVPLPEDATLTEALAAEPARGGLGAGHLARAPSSPARRALVRTVAGLAMSGVVLTCDEVPDRVAASLGAEVVAGLTAPLPARRPPRPRGAQPGAAPRGARHLLHAGLATSYGGARRGVDRRRPLGQRGAGDQAGRDARLRARPGRAAARCPARAGARPARVRGGRRRGARRAGRRRGAGGAAAAVGRPLRRRAPGRRGGGVR